MNDLTNRIKSSEQASTEMTSRKLHQPELLVCSWKGYEGNLADEIALYLAQPTQFAELPAVAPEDFESLFTWFIS